MCNLSNVYDFWFGKLPATPDQEYNDTYEYIIMLIRESVWSRAPTVFTCVVAAMLLENHKKLQWS